jgi:hypothetical protein
MKIDSYDLQETYDKFFELQNYQLEILQSMRASAAEFSGLSSLKGATAEGLKAYMQDVHTTIIDSINMALMEMEIRMMNLSLDFNSSVDSDSAAVLEDAYIESALVEVEGHITSVGSHKSAADDLISSVSDIVALKAPPFSDYVTDLNSVKTSGEDTLQKLSDFEFRHAGDMDNVRQTIAALSSAFEYISNLGSIGKYTPQSACDTEWSQQLMVNQLLAFKYAQVADPNFYDTLYFKLATEAGLTILDELIPDDADIEVIIEYLKNGKINNNYIKAGMDITEDALNLYDLSEGTKDALLSIISFKKGLRFVVDGNNLKIVTKNLKHLTVNQKSKYVQELGLELGRKTRRLLGRALISKDGIELTGKNAYKFKNGKKLLNTDLLNSLSQIAKSADVPEGFWAKFSKGVKNLKGADWALYGLTIAIDVGNSFYNERTDKFDDFDGSDLAGDIIVDTTAFLGPIAIGAAAGSWIPGIGNVVGAAAGFLFALAAVIPVGNPPQSALDHASDAISGAIDDAGNFFKKLFW